MTKLLYPIYKLPQRTYERNIPTWIKYWLYTKSFIKNVMELSQILTGTEFTLLNTINKKFKIFELNGRTEQKQLSGKNKLNVPENLSWTGVKTVNQTIPAGEYTLVWKSFSKGGNDNPYIQFQGANVGGDINSSGTRNITLNRDVSQVLIYSNGYNYGGSQGITSSINQLMLLPATETNKTYEEYCGGIPAPNPRLRMPY